MNNIEAWEKEAFSDALVSKEQKKEKTLYALFDDEAKSLIKEWEENKKDQAERIANSKGEILPDFDSSKFINEWADQNTEIYTATLVQWFATNANNRIFLIEEYFDEYGFDSTQKLDIIKLMMATQCAFLERIATLIIENWKKEKRKEGINFFSFRGNKLTLSGDFAPKIIK